MEATTTATIEKKGLLALLAHLLVTRVTSQWKKLLPVPYSLTKSLQTGIMILYAKVAILKYR